MKSAIALSARCNASNLIKTKIPRERRSLSNRFVFVALFYPPPPSPRGESAMQISLLIVSWHSAICDLWFRRFSSFIPRMQNTK